MNSPILTKMIKYLYFQATYYLAGINPASHKFEELDISEHPVSASSTATPSEDILASTVESLRQDKSDDDVFGDFVDDFVPSPPRRKRPRPTTHSLFLPDTPPSASTVSLTRFFGVTSTVGSGDNPPTYILQILSILGVTRDGDVGEYYSYSNIYLHSES